MEHLFLQEEGFSISQIKEDKLLNFYQISGLQWRVFMQIYSLNYLL